MTSSKSRVEFMEEILMRSKMLNSDKGSMYYFFLITVYD